MPRPRVRSARGQAAAEYVAVLGVIAAVLAAAAAALPGTGVAAAVVRQIELGLCVVGGDLCRDSDARAAGLDPCVIVAEEHQKETGVSIVVVRAAHGHDYSIEQRSDGSVVVRATDGGAVGGAPGLGIRVGPVRLGGTAGAGVHFRRGREWTFRDAAGARRLLDRVPDHFELTDDGDVNYHRAPRAPVRYLEGGGSLQAELEAELGGERAAIALPGFGAEARTAMGRRRAPDATTLYYRLDARTGGRLAELVPALAGEGHWVAEWRTGTPPVLTLRSTTGEDRRVVERTARLVLARRDDRAAALRFALAPLDPATSALVARDLVERIRARGTAQRLVYDERRRERRIDATGRLIVAGGFDHVRSTTRRRLVAAEVVTGGRTMRRADCLGG